MATDESTKASAEELERWRNEGFDAEITCSKGEPAHGLFCGIHVLSFEEPGYIDVGEDEHPCAHDYFLAAVGGCQVEILKQCLEKGRVSDYDIEIDGRSEKERTDIDDEIPETADIRITDMYSDVRVTSPRKTRPVHRVVSKYSKRTAPSR